MSTQDHDPGRKVTRKVNGPVTTPNRFVEQTGTANQVQVVGTQNDPVYGVIETTTRNDQDYASITIDGIAWVESGAAVSDGDDVISDNQGRAITDPATGAVTACVAGKALGAASGAGQVIGVLLGRYKIKR